MMFRGCLKIAIALTVVSSPFQFAAASENVLPNGVFLYGQSAQPNEIGQEYLVFEVQHNQVKGAIYLPDSEFSCFEGTLSPQAMHLSIADSYSQAVYPFEISLQRQDLAASVVIPGTVVELDGYRRLETISDRDRAILNTCLSQ